MNRIAFVCLLLVSNTSGPYASHVASIGTTSTKTKHRLCRILSIDLVAQADSSDERGPICALRTAYSPNSNAKCSPNKLKFHLSRVP